MGRKRQFKIKNGVMEYAIESSVNVQDEILQKELAHTSDEKMKSIISTIQREQLRSLLGMWEEPPKISVVQRSLNKMLVIKNSLALYKDFYQYIGKKEMFVPPAKNTLEWEDVFPFLYLLKEYEGLEVHPITTGTFSTLPAPEPCIN